MNLGKLLLDAKAHIQFVLVVTVIVAVIFVVAVAAERVLFKDNIKSVAKTRKIAVVGMLSAISVVLMLFEIPLPFAPEFYKLDSGCKEGICPFPLPEHIAHQNISSMWTELYSTGIKGCFPCFQVL